MPWKLAVGLDGSLIAIQKDDAVEIRSAENVFSTFPLEPDSDPCLRFVSWSPDGNLLVHCNSTGKLEAFDIAGNRLYEIFSSRERIKEAKIACLFSELRISSSNWITEVMFIGFSGDLQGFFLSHEGFQETCSYSFGRYYPGGVTAAAHHPTQPALFIAGIRSDCKHDKSPSAYGISSWRIVDSDPYFKPLQVFENPASIISFLSSKIFRPKTSYDVVIQMSCSPEGKKLGLIHLSGAISIWNIPSLSLVNYWNLEDQPDFDALSPKMQTIPETKRNKLPLMKNPRKYHPVELSWWSDEHIIISRLSGSVTVCGVESLHNVLELPIVFLDGPPHISHAYRKQGFLALECEVKNLIRKRTVSGDENGYQTFDEEPEEEENMLEKCKRIIYTLVTDKQPPEKTPTFVSNTFRLLHIKPTTPIEVFNEKLDLEEYGEALLLARRYDLDADLVFQRQWKNKEVSLVTIKDYLHKIKNTKWVLNECLTRPANDPDSARELLHYGLKLCDLEPFVALALGNNDYDYDDDEFEDPNLPLDVIMKQRQQKLEYRRKRLIDKVDIDHISNEQKCFLNKRKKLLQYSDRLFIYELVLGGFHRASELFDSKFYMSFRVKDPVAAAYDFANIGNHDALAQMFTYHSHETLPYRLCLLSCIPETAVPYSYRSLLPECSVNGEVFQWETSEIRPRDWSELGKFRALVEQLPVAEEFAIDDSYNQFICQDCNPVMISEWYIQRAKDIDEKTRLACNAADLIRLGVERNIKGLEDIYNDLETLETLIYECQIERYPGLKNLGSISEEDIARKIMAKSTPESFVNDLNYLLLPYLDRLERTRPNIPGNVLKDYLVSLSEDSLSLVALLYQADAREDLIKSDKMLIRIALDCIYACISPSETINAFRIYESLPDRSDEDDDEMNGLQDELDVLHVVLQKFDVLKAFDTTITFGKLRSKSENYHESSKILRHFSRQSIAKAASDENECRTALKVLLKLRQELLSKVSPNQCCEFIVESLLSQGRENLIHLAASLLEGTDVPLDPRLADLGCKIPVSKGQEIALKISLEFIDSASSFDDPALLQAQRCLEIFTEPVETINQQLDFISALFILEEFGVQALPSQVRLNEDKIFYVKEAILARPVNYRKKQKLIELGQLLIPESTKEREIEGLVLNLIAEAAVKANDNSFAIETCKTLIKKQFKNAWKVCWKLANKSGIPDLNQREDLLNFAITYCSDHLMSEILQDKNNLMIEILKSRMQELCNNKLDLALRPEILFLLKEESILTVNLGGHEESSSDYSLGNVRKNIFQVAASAKRIIDVVSKGGEVLSTNMERNSYSTSDVHSNNEFFRVPEFYEDAWNESYKSSPSETRLESIPILRPENELLDFFRLFVNYLVLSNESLNRNVWCDLMQHEFEDNHLQFHALMLYQTDLAEVSKIFERLKFTETGLFYLTYQLSVRILAGMQHFQTSENLFRRSFREVIQRALKIPKSKLDTNELKQCHDLLQQSWKFLGDAIQGRQLKQLDPNVDTGRFAVDRQYKSDTIIGLAMTSDESIFKAALKLAERFDVDVWEVKYSYFAALFLDTNLPAGSLEVKLKENEILQDLKERQEDLEER
ncbi:hypothetical protein QYM36_020070 [Artemia franciscana]|uniref:Neuroblastoma-amplified sequence N-terminal domain-containing protein n=3 Tax=Artemia franciscana TaxID=6661 RepID=A0AA88H0F5_ARTSF|nr:hypothetical protein QYM36_020070 [Artemia franciscana]